jgi:hypothetical protein
MANPPPPTGHTDTTTTPLTKGTVVHYGLEDLTIAGIIIDSYKRSGKYNKVDEIVNQKGITEGIRMSDYRAEISVSGRMLASDGFIIEVGDVLTINSDNILVHSVDMSASATGFTTVDVSGTSYEGVTGLEPN